MSHWSLVIRPLRLVLERETTPPAIAAIRKNKEPITR